MRANTKGITLLEILLATLLMGVFTLTGWGVFHKVYMNYHQNQKAIRQIEKGRMVLEFIQEEIKMSESVKIDVEGQKDILSVEEEVVDRVLDRVTLYPDKNNRSNKNTFLLVNKLDRGYTLNYEKQDVAEGIKSLTVSKRKGSSLVDFTFTAEEATGNSLSTTLRISLKHK